MQKPIFRLAIVGGRDFTLFEEVCKSADAVLSEKVKTHTIVIVCGMAEGADLLGKKYGELRGYEVEEFHAQWKDLTTPPVRIKKGKYGEYNALAGHNRNAEMRKAADGVLAFWDQKSKGTKEMIEECIRHKIPLRITTYEVAPIVEVANEV